MNPNDIDIFNAIIATVGVLTIAVICVGKEWS